jgi:hypothetical protein
MSAAALKHVVDETHISDVCWLLLLCRVFELPLIGGSSPGNYTISGTTTTPDSNPGNDAATTKLTLIATCIKPLGTGSTLTCPPGQAYVGPNDKQINSSDVFAAQCCVSPSLIGNLLNTRWC